VSDLYWDPFDIELDREPYEVWRRLRDDAPLYRNDRYDFYALSRYADVEAAHRDNATYSSAHGTVLEMLSPQPMGGGFMIFMDPGPPIRARVPRSRRGGHAARGASANCARTCSKPNADARSSTTSRTSRRASRPR
jgi:hypothetical protein